jgi:transposase
MGGGYEVAVIDVLEARGFVVVPFNAQRIRLFAKAKGRLAKNNRGDARTIAQATARLLHGVLAPRRRDLDPLVEHLTCRRQIPARIADCTNQLERLRDRTLRETIKRRRTALQQELAGLDKRLAKLVAEHDDWYVLEQRLRTVPGVGPVLVHTLIGQLSGGRSPAWSASHPSGGPYQGQPRRPSARCCTWPRWSPNATTR